MWNRAMRREHEDAAVFRCFCGEPAIAFCAHGAIKTFLCPVHLSLSDPFAAGVYAKMAHLRKGLPAYKMNWQHSMAMARRRR